MEYVASCSSITIRQILKISPNSIRYRRLKHWLIVKSLIPQDIGERGKNKQANGIDIYIGE